MTTDYRTSNISPREENKVKGQEERIA
uniref:Uncharacterized protein n=1 Tax=Anguilla anguilla TaxID=7936 RepID=A0A0E9S0D3_ANGAN